MMNMDGLKAMSRDELVQLAAKYNLPIHHRAKEDTIIKAILDADMNLHKPTETQPEQPQAPKPVVHKNTPEMVREAIAQYTARGLEATFPDDGTWIFKYKGAEESGNLAIPLKVIVDRALFVSKGRRALAGLAPSSPGKGYSDAVLSA